MRHLSPPTLLATGLAAATLAVSSQAVAYGAGDFFTRVGVANIAPKSDNGSLAGGAFAVDAQDKTDFAFTLGYRSTTKWAWSYWLRSLSSMTLNSTVTT